MACNPRPALIWATLALALLSGLAWAGRAHVDVALSRVWALAQGRYSVEDRIEQFGDAARARLAPHYAAAGMVWPGKRVALLAFKDSDRLELHAQDAGGAWKAIRSYPVLAASGGLGPKLREGDLQVPEGFYRVNFLNANSLFHVSLRLDYPNAFDREQARADGRRELGGDIMIHGKAVSVGCLAMGDAAAEELFTLAADIGVANIEVLIAPTDLRRQEHPTLPKQPAWVAGLHGRLGQSLRRFQPIAAAD